MHCSAVTLLSVMQNRGGIHGFSFFGSDQRAGNDAISTHFTLASRTGSVSRFPGRRSPGHRYRIRSHPYLLSTARSVPESMTARPRPAWIPDARSLRFVAALWAGQGGSPFCTPPARSGRLIQHQAVICQTRCDTPAGGGLLAMASRSALAPWSTNSSGSSFKDQARTDWLARPLTPRQLEYAARMSSSAALYDKVMARLRERGKFAWFEQECQKPLRPQDPGQRSPSGLPRIVNAWQLGRRRAGHPA